MPSTAYGRKALEYEISGLSDVHVNFRNLYRASCVRICALVKGGELDLDYAKTALVSLGASNVDPSDALKLFNSAHRKALPRTAQNSPTLPWFHDFFERRSFINKWYSFTQSDKSLTSTDRLVCEYLAGIMLKSAKLEVAASYRQISLAIGVAYRTIATSCARRLHGGPLLKTTQRRRGLRTLTLWKISSLYVEKSQSTNCISTLCFRPGESLNDALCGLVDPRVLNPTLDYWSSGKTSLEVFRDCLFAIVENNGNPVAWTAIETTLGRSTLFKHLKHLTAEGVLVNMGGLYGLGSEVNNIPLTSHKNHIRAASYDRYREKWTDMDGEGRMVPSRKEK